MPNHSTPDYYPAGILCPGGHCEGSAKPRQYWVSDLCPFGMLKPHRHWNLPDEDNTYTSYYFDKPLDIDFYSDCGTWTTFGKMTSVTCYTNYGSMMVSTNANNNGAYIELDTEIDSIYVLKIYITGYTTNSTWQVSARDNQGSIIESATVTQAGEISFEFEATTSTSRVYIVRTGGYTSSTININQLSVTGKYPKKEELYLSYRYGFNSQEKDDEIYGTGNSYTAEYWQYDSRLGRRWNVDPVDKPWMSSYHAFSNKPILNIDPNGANDTKYYDKDDPSVLIKDVDDGIDQSVLVDRSEFESAIKFSQTMGLDINNSRDDALTFTNTYSANAKNIGLTFKNTGNLPTINNVLEGKQWISYKGDCFEAARQQNIIGGGVPVGSDKRIDVYNSREPLVSNLKPAFRVIQANLRQGKPVMVGVGHGEDVNNSNPSTSHFVNIVGQGNDGYGNFLMFWDNSFYRTDTKANRLYWNETEKSFFTIPEVYPNPTGMIGGFVLTEIRPNH